MLSAYLAAFQSHSLPAHISPLINLRNFQADYASLRQELQLQERAEASSLAVLEADLGADDAMILTEFEEKENIIRNKISQTLSAQQPRLLGRPEDRPLSPPIDSAENPPAESNDGIPPSPLPAATILALPAPSQPPLVTSEQSYPGQSPSQLVTTSTLLTPPMVATPHVTNASEETQQTNQNATSSSTGKKRKRPLFIRNIETLDKELHSVRELALRPRDAKAPQAEIGAVSESSTVLTPHESSEALKSIVPTAFGRGRRSTNTAAVRDDEIVLSVSLFHTKKNVEVQEWLVLGSQKLTELRDLLYCLNDHAFDGPNTPSGFFFIENVFYSDMRDPNAKDYCTARMGA